MKYFSRGVGRRFRVGLGLALGACVAPAALPAQDTGPAPADGAGDVALKPALTPADYGQWESLGFGELSPDGRWLSVPISRVNDEDELRIRRVGEDSVVVVPYGRGAAFSADGRWVAYTIGHSEAARERAEERDERLRSRLGLLNLATGDTALVPDVAGFAFSGDGRYLLMQRYPPRNGDAKGADVVVRDLATGTDTRFGDVGAYAWRKDGHLLAMAIDAEGLVGNGVQLYDAATGVLRTLESEQARYTGLTWAEEHDHLAVLRALPDTVYDDTTHVVVAWQNAPSRSPRRHVLDPRSMPEFPTDARIVEHRDVRWSEDGERLFFGVQQRTATPDTIAPVPSDTIGQPAPDTAQAPADSAAAQRDEPDEDEEEKPGVEVWHWKDIEIIPEQKVDASRNRRENELAVWDLAAGRFIRLGGGEMEQVLVAEGDLRAIGLDRTPYDEVRMFGPVYYDVYGIDVRSGERTKLRERVQYQFGPSETGRYLLFMVGDDYWTHDLRTGEQRNLTGSLATSFVDLEDDHTVEQKPPYGTGGWSEDDRVVLLYDEHDVWAVRPDGSDARRLTRGREEGVVHRRVWLDREDRGFAADEPIYFSLYGEKTKEYGYARMRGLGGTPERLVYEPRAFSRLTKADSAEVYAYVREDYEDSPDYYVGGPLLRDARQVTRTNPFQRQYAWGRAELIEYQNAWGDTMQAALFYPANYEPGRRYPMLVYIYEITSPTVRRYSVPSERSPYNTSVFNAEGYFVLRPDIRYRDRQPGTSAVAHIVPAVERALETGMIDPEGVGLVGHSWGGYQTAFTVTQTDVFNAAVAGAPLTNLISMYLSIYWNTGSTDARIFEISQGRMEVPFWEDTQSYIENSPVFHIENMNTPLLVEFGTKDGAVEFNQGVEFYNAARRAGKPLVMLVYEGENHGLAREPNQLDYHRRILEWFGHHLKGEPAPRWIAEGIPFLEQEKMFEVGGTGDPGTR